jgi:hypothetical protein
MQLLGWWRKRRLTTESGHPVKEVPPLKPDEGGIWYLAVPMTDLTTHVLRYVDGIETGQTKDWCRCVWKFHPDDMDKPEGSRRKRRMDDDLTCPIHSKEGFLLGFFDWLEKNA